MSQFNSQTLSRSQKKAGRPKSSTPMPFRQGGLDSLCGLYALINALRLAQSKGAFKANVDWLLLFRDILEALERKWWMREIVLGGMDSKEMQFCLRTAKAYLLRRHHIRMHIVWPWKGREKFKLKPELKKLERMLQHKSMVAIIGYTKKRYDHWSVIQSIDTEAITLYDSLGSKPLKLSQLHFDRHQILKDDMTCVIGPEDLILIELEQAVKG